jgi:hypothetical protein
MLTTNAASRAVAAASGAVAEGVLRNKARREGHSYDTAVFSFTPSDFQPAGAPAAGAVNDLLRLWSWTVVRRPTTISRRRFGLWATGVSVSMACMSASADSPPSNTIG